MAISDAAKLQTLAEQEGYDTPQPLLEAVITDSVCPGICCNPDDPSCDYSTEVEPDQDKGWCEACDAGTVKSALVLAGLI